MPEPQRTILAVITGERGQREIVRPLATAGQPCTVLDWEERRVQPGAPHPRFMRELWQLLRAHRGAVVFTDMNSAFLAVILLFARMHGSRVIMRLRGDPFAETRDQLEFHWRKREWRSLPRVLIAWLLDRPLFAIVDRFVAVSHWIVRRLGIEDRSAVVRVPLPAEQFPPRVHRATQPVRLLAVTNFNYPQKVAALGRFLNDYANFLRGSGFSVTVAGAGIAWQAFCEEHARHADFPGFVRDVARLYAEHDVFVHFSDLDAFPYVVLEAQAAGLPVIVNRACGMLEQIADGDTGLIVDLEDRAAIETHLRQLRDSPELRNRLGTAARRHILETYSLEAIGRELIEHALAP